MVATILEWLASLVISVIDAIGYVGIFLLMVLDSFNIPIPSEVTMPFSGFLASKGSFSFWLVVLAGTVGSYIGSVASYYLAGWLITNRKKLFLHFILNDAFLEEANAWFVRYGSASIFFGRIIPIVRTFISLPAGLGRVPFRKFTYYTIAGSLMWSIFLTYIGWILGENWEHIRDYFHRFDIVVAVLIGAGVAWWAYRHFRVKRNG
ncbi:hypothetical protein A2755_00735 [Candidatus Wolfebacteria bacterium RIFCSPHIGHO2_01_FULL_48_22]|uniref:VTT domain-containing protein n=2 Tax=Candidatus Wolfeibacteriota TaxID=1752735 RepID=A0A1F8DTZ0_9BACT|nr:MAG: hypothetical protein A2755_00735 [Candidatus Wolfebacteria bacterium RIFCSPHIGHO2_01_FULL_48_22]OGM93541.1 MAG: hypothetical protein A2935_02845 [Candidatus Wolfebacteria bacterium RIFCSPLOWO2_01_FULL_47_17b]